MRNTILLIFFLPAFAVSQNVGQFGYVFAKDSFRLKAIVDSISTDSSFLSASNRKLATTYAVKSYADRHIGGRSALTTAPTDGQIWKWSAANSRWEPATDATSGGGGTVVATDTIWNTKGDLAAATGSDAAIRLGIGVDGTVLTADSGEPTGMKWEAISGGVTDGDKGDIDVTSGATVWTVDTSAITTIKVAANAIDSTKIINGGVSVLDLGQHGATSGQALKWNGTQWAAADDSGVTGSGVSGQVTFWNGASTITGETAFTYNATTDALGIGLSTPVSITNTAITTAAGFTFGNSSSAATLGGSTGTVTVLSSSTSSSAILIRASNATGGIDFYNGDLFSGTSGTRNGARFRLGFIPSSGNGVLNQLSLEGTFAQSGTASGITRGIYLNQTLTSVADFRALEIAANGANGKAIYQTGATMVNNLVGNTRIGSTSTPARTLDVTGEVRISDLTTDNPTGLVGADADGDLSRVKLGTGLSFSNDTLSATASGTVDGTGAAGQVAFWSDSNTITGEDSLFYNATTNRLGVNTNVPDNKVTVKTNTTTDGIQIESDGTTDQDPGWLRFKSTQTGPFTQYGWMTLDGFSNGGASPEGQAYVFKLQTTGYSARTPLSLYKDQAIFSSTSQFYITNNAAGRFIFSVPSAYDHNFQNNVLVTGSSFTTADTTIRLSVVGRTQTSASWGLRVWDGNKQSIFQVRDDARVGITATTLDASLTINGAGATSGTYGLMVTPSGGTTTTGTLVVRDDNRVGIRTNAPQAPLNVVGTGTTSSTTALLVEGSGGQDNLNVRDDGVSLGQGFGMVANAPTIAFASAAGTGPVNDLCQGGANGFVLFFTTGTSPTTNAAIFTATLPKFYPNGVIATITCGDTDCLDEIADIYISGTGNNSVTLTTRGTLTASTAYVIYITCFGY